jgi:hypothetical protein
LVMSHCLGFGEEEESQQAQIFVHHSILWVFYACKRALPWQHPFHYPSSCVPIHCSVAVLVWRSQCVLLLIWPFVTLVCYSVCANLRERPRTHSVSKQGCLQSVRFTCRRVGGKKTSPVTTPEPVGKPPRLASNLLGIYQQALQVFATHMPYQCGLLVSQQLLLMAFCLNYQYTMK